MSEPSAKFDPLLVHETAAARELRSGFAWLRFKDATLEHSFRHAHWQDSRTSVNLHIWLSIALVLSFILIDQFVVARATTPALLCMRITALGILLVSVALTSRGIADRRLYQLAIPVLASVFGLCVIMNELIDKPHTVSFIPLVVLTVFGIYLLFGMLFKPALVAGLLVLVEYLLSAWLRQVPHNELVYNGTILLFSNILAASACYSMERLRRTSFLEATLLSDMANRDGLTGIYNRRAFDEHLDRHWQQAARSHRPLAVLLIDIDHFKAYNDYYGHQVGDQCLQQVARILSGVCGSSDFAARYGGEEFAVVLREPEREQVAEVAKRIQVAIHDLALSHPASAARLLTVSIGAAHVQPEASRSIYGCIQLADEALYDAKETGRDCIVIKERDTSELGTGAFRQSATLEDRLVS